MSTKKVVLFDFDGTLADSFESFLSVIQSISEKYHLPTLSREELEQLRAEDAHTIMKKLKIPLWKVPFIARDYKRLQLKVIEDIKPFKGIENVLYSLKENGYELGIVTSNSKKNVMQFLHNHNFENFTYLYYDSSIFGKASTFRKFLAQNKISPREVIYVGDEIRDITACRAVGVEIIAVTWGFTTKKGLLQHKPDYCVESPKELLSVIQKLFKND